jgi:catechol 2,3-dioxygenase-like lactoylglutathione lyase family enzyme
VPDVHHIGYVVSDLETGVGWAVQTLAAGPFFAIEHMRFDEVTYLGGSAEFDHSSAFGSWGPILVELTVVHDAKPEGLRRALAGEGAGIGHVAWLADSLEQETQRLQAAGLRRFHTGRTGPASAAWFDGPGLGHHIEVLQRSEPLLAFYARVRAAATTWDGADPIRSVA